MINLLIPILSMAFLLKSNISRKRTLFCPSSFVFVLFLFSFLTSFIYVYDLGYTDVLRVENFEAVLYLTSILLLFFWCIYRYNENKIQIVVIPGRKLLIIMMFVVIILSMISIAYFFPIAVKGFMVSSILETRNEIRLEGINPFITESLINTISSSAALFYQLAIILFFISLIIKTKRILTWLLFISSFSYILYVFAYLGRDGILFWIFSFISVYSFFYKFLQRKNNKIILFVFLVFSVLGLIAFFIITINRFGNNSSYEHGIFGGLIDYFGQTISNFCDIYTAKFHLTNGGYSFPYFRSLFGLDEIKRDVLEVQLSWQNVPSWVWGTFVRSFYTDFGTLGVFILGCFFNLIFIIVTKTRNTSTVNLSTLIIYFLFIQIYSQGVFYFRQYTKGMNLNILLTFIIALCLFIYIRVTKKKSWISTIGINIPDDSFAPPK